MEHEIPIEVDRNENVFQVGDIIRFLYSLSPINEILQNFTNFSLVSYLMLKQGSVESENHIPITFFKVKIIFLLVEGCVDVFHYLEYFLDVAGIHFVS